MMNSESLPMLRGRYAHTIFCDDVRREDSGKLLIVGMYGSWIGVPSFPAYLPSLHMMVQINTPHDQPFKKLELKVILGDDELASMDMPCEAMEAELKANTQEYPIDLDEKEGTNSVLVRRVVSFLNITPLQVASASALKVRIVTESEIIAAGAVNIGLMPDGANT
ncbi:DUF6941 family protein [Xanthomonas euroxanthea]|uniref:DUF6941 family protein n=1 Tax=Xanthomonas euroxanthea TaxID=2259622 RepID=UPI003CCEB998